MDRRGFLKGLAGVTVGAAGGAAAKRVKDEAQQKQTFLVQFPGEMTDNIAGPFKDRQAAYKFISQMVGTKDETSGDDYEEIDFEVIEPASPEDYKD